MTKWTPGPWRVGPVDDTAISTMMDNHPIAVVHGDYTDPDIWPVMEANARLIAEAPAMAEALKEAAILLGMAWNRIHPLPRSRDTELCHDIGINREKIRAILARIGGEE